MTISGRLGVRSIAAIGLVATALALTACGADSRNAASSERTHSASTTPTATPSPAPPTPTKPLSKYEGRPQVKVVRAFAKSYAEAINARDRHWKTLRKYTTTTMGKILTDNAKADLNHYVPGPFPFTPTRVTTTPGKTVVAGCWQAYGWIWRSQAVGHPYEKVRKQAINITMIRSGGRWVIDTIYTDPARERSHACKGVATPGFMWNQTP